MSKKALLLVLIVTFVMGFSEFVRAADPIKIGAPTPLSGPYVSDGVGYNRGVKMAVDDLNEAGGLLGRKVKIIRFDVQQFEPERVMQAADELVVKKKVVAVHAGWAGWGQDVRAYGKYEAPTFVWDGSDEAIAVWREDPEKYSNFFHMVDGQKAHSVMYWRGTESLPYEYPNKKAVVINADDAWCQGVGDGIKEMAKKSGWDVPMHETVPYGVREWRPILAKIREIKPSFLYMEVLSTPDMVTFFRQFMRAPTKTILNFGYGIQFIDFIENMGTEIDGLVGMSSGMPLPVAPTPEGNDWLRRFRKKYDAEPSTGSFYVYNGVMFWAKAVQEVGDPNKLEAINDYIATKPFKSISGGIWKFNEDHVLPFSADVPCLTFQVQNGQRVTLYTAPGVQYRDYEFLTPRWVK